jgi:uncharacterized protein (TIGR02996 family)
MADEATLLRLMHDRPDDIAARLVYADWLEEQGDSARARIVRTAITLAGLPLAEALEPAAALLALRKRISKHWLAAISYPSLIGTCWGTRDAGGEQQSILAFQPDGVLVFQRKNGRYPGTWSQVGTAVEYTINKFSPHEGVFVDHEMRGHASNKAKQVWTWGALRIADDALTAEPFPDLSHCPCDSAYAERPKVNLLPKAVAGGSRAAKATASSAGRRRSPSARRTTRSRGGKGS